MNFRRAPRKNGDFLRGLVKTIYILSPFEKTLCSKYVRSL